MPPAAKQRDFPDKASEIIDQALTWIPQLLCSCGKDKIHDVIALICDTSSRKLEQPHDFLIVNSASIAKTPPLL